MADQNKVTSTGFTAEKVERVNGLLQKIKDEAGQAATDNDAYMLGVYQEIMSVVSPIVIRAIARVEREARASINRQHKGLKKAARQARATAQDTTATA